MTTPVIGETLYAVLPTHRVLMLTICNTEKLELQLCDNVYMVQTKIHFNETPTHSDRVQHSALVAKVPYLNLDTDDSILFSTKAIALQVALRNAQRDALTLSDKLTTVNKQIEHLTAQLSV